jgi:hypothetical protein
MNLSISAYLIPNNILPPLIAAPINKPHSMGRKRITNPQIVAERNRKR